LERGLAERELLENGALGKDAPWERFLKKFSFIADKEGRGSFRRGASKENSFGERMSESNSAGREPIEKESLGKRAFKRGLTAEK
jgi:hypothetical protein